MSDNLRIIADFNGANPAEPGRIREKGKNMFTILPYSEDGDPNYKFRLDIRVINRSAEPQSLHLTIDWEETRFNHLRDYCYIGGGDGPWRYITLKCAGGKAYGNIEIPPGITYLCMHPAYSCEDYSAFVEKICGNGIIDKKAIGTSPQGRKLWLLKIRKRTARPKRRVLVVGRIHPYETAGSYCIEGIARSLLNHHQDERTLLEKCEIYLIPMANPDGVASGLCKKTAVDGIDLSKATGTVNDGTWQLLKRAVDAIRPHVYCEIHNWMFKDSDGIYFLNRLQARRFIKHMPSQQSAGKKWKVILRRRFFSIPPHGFKKYCRERFGSTCLCLEYPWFGRSTNDMRKMGADSLRALAPL